MTDIHVVESPTGAEVADLTNIAAATPLAGDAVATGPPPVTITNILTNAFGAMVPPFPFGLSTQCSRPTSTQRTDRMVARREAEESARNLGCHFVI